MLTHPIGRDSDSFFCFSNRVFSVFQTWRHKKYRLLFVPTFQEKRKFMLGVIFLRQFLAVEKIVFNKKIYTPLKISTL